MSCLRRLEGREADAGSTNKLGSTLIFDSLVYFDEAVARHGSLNTGNELSIGQKESTKDPPGEVE